MNSTILPPVAQSAGAERIECFVYDTEQPDGEAPVMLPPV